MPKKIGSKLLDGKKNLISFLLILNFLLKSILHENKLPFPRAEKNEARLL